ncbi:transcription antitermination factor NusB [Alienimonas californiensis]|uniref:Ribosomal RNA small subunit methyltransferase B n=1 Tax=Alienimonas californiensis TaxID=2527989 RepID=A0A517P939_9PLAN|nr:transcription antitermination factor NusB [Alienimonas californiensis]QDT15889.1 Ribosomal RNA small subunit methyltransferase B [Alienimonas californiensis]
MSGSPRALAHEALLEQATTQTFAQDLLERRWADYDVPAVDRRLISDLVFGTVRRRATLDAVLQAHLNRPLADLEPGLRTLLRLGAYQLALTGGIPPHAAVHETVAVAEISGAPRWTGLTNGVLRSLARAVYPANDEPVPAPGPAADAVPLPVGPGDADRWRKVGRRVFPDPTDDPAGYFAAAFAFPRWLARRWAERLEPTELWALGFHFNRPPVPTLRVNPLKGDRESLLAALAEAGVAATAGATPQSIRLAEGANVVALPGFPEGRFSVQDETAQGAAALLAPRAGERVLDLCAAPGTKTTHLAELSGDAAEILAADVSSQRLEKVSANAQRLGLSSIRTQATAADASDLPGLEDGGLFDAALVDVPCSNTGVLGKRPEARWRVKASDLPLFAASQTDLLAAALERVKPGGRCVYSTCSVEPEENAGVVAAALADPRFQDWKVVRSVLHWPGRPGDGGFQALLVRRGASG